MKLSVLGNRAAETTLCTYCPKLCRPACPVSTIEGRETVTPWGKMRAMGELVRGVAPADAAHVAPAYACTGCMHCFELCDLDNPVADSLRDGRAEAFRLGVAPEPARALAAGFVAREAALQRASDALLEARPHAPAPSPRVAYFPGCTAVTFERASIRGVARAVAALDAPAATSRPATVVADVCCGLPLLEAGDRDGFVERARRAATRLAPFERVVVGDAGCAHALRVLYPSVGVGVAGAVVHLAEAAAASLPRVERLADVPRNVAYHDACRLGRGLGVYDEPRAVLARLLGAAPLELPESRERAACSGAGGLLPRTRPATASAIAHELAGLAREAGADAVVSACAASRRALRGAGVAALDLGELVARALGGEPV